MPGMNVMRATWLADQIAAAATALDSGLTGLREAPSVGTAVFGIPLTPVAFGDTPGARSCLDAYQSAKGNAATATRNLAMVLSSDDTRLREVIRVFQTVDAESADELCTAAAGLLTVYSAHLTSGREATDDAQRAVQTDNLSTELPDNAVLIGMDANMDYRPDGLADGDDLGPQSLGDLVSDHGLVDVGDVDGASEQQELSDAGEQRGSGEDVTGDRDIDHVLTSDTVTAGEPALIDKDEVGGNLLDHDGTVVQVQPPRW